MYSIPWAEISHLSTRFRLCVVAFRWAETASSIQVKSAKNTNIFQHEDWEENVVVFVSKMNHFSRRQKFANRISHALWNQINWNEMKSVWRCQCIVQTRQIDALVFCWRQRIYCKSHDLDCAWNLQPDIHAACVDHDMQLIHVENCISRRHKNEITSIKGLQSLWIGSVQLHCMHFMHFTHVGVANIKATTWTWTTTTATRIVISMSTYMRLLCIHESYVASNALQWFYNHTALLFTMLDWRKVKGNRYFVETWYFYKQNLNSCYEGREVWLYIFRNI